MHLTKKILTFLCLLLAIPLFSANASSPPVVVVSIPPLHSITAAVMEGRGEPQLIVSGNRSLHGFRLKPSQLRAIQKADLLLYIDEDFENFLARALKILPRSVDAFPLLSTSGLKLLPKRQGGLWEQHDHHHDEHEEEHEHGEHEGHDEHEEEHKYGEHERHDEHEDHNSSNIDWHVWLDVDNAKVLAKAIARELSRIDPDYRRLYLRNAKRWEKAMDQLDLEVKSRLMGMENRPFLVFHDAYQYFENAYNLKALGSLTLEPNEQASARQIQKIRRRLQLLGIVCIFSEPQFSDRLVTVVTENTNIKKGVLDPLGSVQSPGKSLYPKLIQAMAMEFERALK